jgi:anti-sigma regulatory factor (Ser/Thr protein kinase)
MRSRGVLAQPRIDHGYRHEAFVYAGLRDFVPSAIDFIEAGLRADEPTLVVVDEDKIEALRDRLGDDAERVTFADMTDVGSNPGRIIGYWHAFLESDGRHRPVRGIGEPIYPARPPAELVECQLLETLLNLAVPAAQDLWLLCPYDRDSLPDDVLAEAFRSHPFVASADDQRPSALYQPPDPATLFGGELTAAPDNATRAVFGPADLGALRRLVADHAIRLRFHPLQVDEIKAALNELATNAIQHGPGIGSARIWNEDDVLFFEVADGGCFSEPLAGRLPGDPTQIGGRGLWIANKLCDLLQIRSSPSSGTVVRGQVRRIGSR